MPPRPGIARLPVVIVVVAAIALAMRLALMAYRFSIDLVFWDQWDFLEPFFRGSSLLEAFRWQHGPHRQGLASLVYAVLLPATSWSGRAEALVAVGLVATSCAIALSILRSAAGPSRLSDVFVPLAFFGLSSWQLFAGEPNLANGPLHILLCLALARALHLADLRARTLVLGVGSAAAVYTGFAAFLAPPAFVLLLLEWRRARGSADRAAVAASLALVAGSAASFFVGYKWLPAVPCFRFPHFPLSDYAVFLAGVTGRAWGVFYPVPHRYLELRVGLSLLLLAATTGAALLGLRSVWRAPREDRDAPAPAGPVVFLLCGFSVLFVAFVAVGRTCLGPVASLASRYTIYVVPGMFGLFLAIRARALAAHRPRLLAASATALALLLVVKERRSSADRDSAGWMAVKKSEWVQCYLARPDVSACDAAVGFSVYPPESRDAAHVAEKLDFLRERRLSLYAFPPARFEAGRRLR